MLAFSYTDSTRVVLLRCINAVSHCALVNISSSKYVTAAVLALGTPRCVYLLSFRRAVLWSSSRRLVEFERAFSMAQL